MTVVENTGGLIVRPEADGDSAAISKVLVEAFPTVAEAGLVDALRADGHLAVSLIAEADGAVVGHVAFSPVTVPGASAGIGLAPVAVLGGYRRRGIADHLIREGLAACRHLASGFVVVLGDPAYYGRFGFETASKWDLSDEYGGGDAFQAMELQPGAIPAGGGLVTFAPAFAALADDE